MASTEKKKVTVIAKPNRDGEFERKKWHYNTSEAIQFTHVILYALIQDSNGLI